MKNVFLIFTKIFSIIIFLFGIFGYYLKLYEISIFFYNISEKVYPEKDGINENNIGIAYFKLGKFEKSKEFFQKAINENSNYKDSWQYYYNLGDTFFMLAIRNQDINQHQSCQDMLNSYKNFNKAEGFKKTDNEISENTKSAENFLDKYCSNSKNGKDDNPDPTDPKTTNDLENREEENRKYNNGNKDDENYRDDPSRDYDKPNW